MAAFKYLIQVVPNPLTPAGKQKIEAGEGDELVMELTNPAHQPAPSAHPYKLMFLDCGGLYMFAGKDGDRTWRTDYHIGKSWQTSEIGHYPEMAFNEALRKSRLQKRRVAQGKIPVPRINRYSMNGSHWVLK